MHDVVILGAGVAGSFLAHLLKEKGIDVVVIDKQNKNNAGSYKNDSGMVSTEFLDVMKDMCCNAGRRSIRTAINTMKLVSPSKKTITIHGNEPFAFLLNKNILEENLHTGLKVQNENTWKIEILRNHVHVWTDKNDYECKIVVGADGANSLVRKQMGLKENINIDGIILRTKKYVDTNEVEVYFNKAYSQDYYAWSIPLNREFGILLGNENENKLTCIENFRNDMNLTDLTMNGAPIPIGFVKSYADRCILVGDAASQTKPLTGGGIVFALKCCKHAAETIENALKAEDYTETMLSNYEAAWKAEIGETIKKQLFFRKIYRKLTNKDIDSIFDTVGTKLDNVDFKNYDSPDILWRSLPKTSQARILLKATKGLIKATL